MTDPIGELVVRTAAADRAAFTALYNKVSGAVYGSIKAVLRDGAMSEEVAQDVLVEVWRTAARFDPSKGSGQAWILTMARRRAIDRVRSEQAARRRTEAVGAASIDPDRDTTYAAVERRDEHAAVATALSDLTDLQRDVITRAYFDGKTYREVAEDLELPLGTVKTRMRDGLIRLRETMGATI